MDDPRSDHELVHEAQAGDLTAAELFARRWYDKVWRWAFAVVRDPDRASDVTQQVFESFRTRLQNPDPIRVPASYLRRIVQTKAVAAAIQARNATTTQSPLDDAPEPSGPQDDWADDLDALDLLGRWLQAIATAVSLRSADIAYLMMVGFSPAEIVKQLDDEVPDVAAVHRTKHRLKERWSAVTEEYNRQPVLAEWASRRWGRTLKKEAK